MAGSKLTLYRTSTVYLQ